MNWLLRSSIARIFRSGTLTVTGPDGSSQTFGDGTGRPAHLTIRTHRAERAILVNPWMGVPEMYMAGEVEFPDGDIVHFLSLAYGNLATARHSLTSRLFEGISAAVRRLQQINTAARARRNVHHHYDLSGDLYRLFLDEDMQYSCAYFERPDMSLEDAQRAKKRHIAAKLNLKPGNTVLDIGSGWGGLGLYLARRFEADVVGVTLSTEQHAVSVERAQNEGLDAHVHFELRDYRDISERFDRVVSVGMFEHVGLNHYPTYFNKCARLMKPDGVMLLHTIGRSAEPAATTPFIRKYIFPGGYIPSMSDMLPAIEKSGLVVTDVEILRLHYAETLKHWRERFMANRQKAVEIYDERFARMWEFYLAGSEASFRYGDLVVFQMQLARRNDSLPLTRDYIGKCEKALAMHELGHRTAGPGAKRPGGRNRRHPTADR